ncbi:MAG: leucine--tRNA ligase [Cyclobacteriaceae bacterium]
MQYNFKEIAKKWQKHWTENNTFTVTEDTSKPKYYVLDMFPYPSGAGLHVGHPLGYIATDIVARYKKLNGYNVLHPIGFDSFGLPAEQYAIQTGQHPAVTTEQNITRYIEQLGNLGFAYDWDREIRTSDPSYYKWTQWIFIQLFESWYNTTTNKAEAIETLIAVFEKKGNTSVQAECDEETPSFTATEWNEFSEKEQRDILLNYRLTYLSETEVNWCPKLGTVLANDEIKDGLSERGGYPVERKKMKQWSMRITAYAQRLLDGLEKVEWSDALKEMQRNWIGKSIGCSLRFQVTNHDFELEVFTTRVDTTFGVTYLSIAPEHNLIATLTTPEQKKAVEGYVAVAKNRSERERQSDVKTVSGVFTGSYATNPFTGEEIPIWIADYVLSSYGTGVVMAVPCSDERDYRFASHYNIPIVSVQEGERTDISQDNFDPKAGTMINSNFLNGLTVKEAIPKAIEFVENKGIGKSKTQFRLRDAIFSRQRYWGEPIPIYYKDGIPYPLPESELPLVLPEVEKYLPTETGEPPLGRATDWNTKEGHPIEMNTMPGWAGSSWYFYRYMDATNGEAPFSKENEAYWKNVDFYLGGSEHATGHLLYARFWNNFLFDRGFVSEPEAFKKLVNQGMIQGRSSFVYRIKDTNKFVSKGLKNEYETSPIHVDVALVNNDKLDIEAFKKWRPDLKDTEFILENGAYICGSEIEKMSKSKYNVVNPDDLVDQYGADTLRLYEMFLGPLEQSKPWNTKGIEGSHKFLRKLWRAVVNEDGTLLVNDDKASADSLKTINTAIKKIGYDVDSLSLNTSVSAFMVCVNELSKQKCSSKEVFEKLLIILSPYAPHITEELWQLMGHTTSITGATFPEVDESTLKEDAHEYPISINGKMRTKLNFSMDLGKEEIEKQVLANEIVLKWTEGKTPKKIIVVPKKIVNVVM